jgi:hypothetical protein
LIILSYSVTAQKSIYEISMQTIDSVSFSMSVFKGKKIIIATSSPEALHSGGLKYYDSLQKAFPDTKVIVIPAEDLNGIMNREFSLALKNTLQRRVTICMLTSAKKSAARNQNNLMKWLTSVNDNKHFDLDVRDEPIYVISECGALYALLDRNVTAKQWQEVLSIENLKP